MHRAMSLSTIVMNAAGVTVAVLFVIAAHDMPEFAIRSGAIYAGVLLLATFASERIRAHILHHDAENSPACCASAVRVSRILLGSAWIVMVVLLVDLAIGELF